MAQIKLVQNSFTSGEVGTYLDARQDLDIYKTGAKTIENFFVLPQGGLLRRGGFEYISGVSSTEAETGFSSHSRLIPFRFSTEQEYVLIFETGKFTVVRNGLVATTKTDSLLNNFTSSNINEWRYAQTFDTLIMVHPDYHPIQITRTSHTSWTVANVSFTFLPLANFDNGIDLNPNAVAATTLTASSDPTSHFAVGEYVQINGGLCKITSFSGTNNVTINVTTEEKLANDQEATSSEYQQTAFSSSKGYPTSVTFHQNRLIFGGSKTKPQTIFGSQTGDFFNFKATEAVIVDSDTVGQVNDSTAFSFTIGSDSANIVRHVVSKQTLFIFTSDGEFEMTGNPVTPTNVNIRLQTKYGMDNNGAVPTTVDNEVMFVSANGRELRGFVFDFNSDGYYAKNYTIIAHDVLSSPQDITHLRSHKNTNQNYVIIVNDNGELGVFGINVEKQVAGWSRFTTNGKFKKVVAVHDVESGQEIQRLYAIVERTRKKDDGNEITCYHLERLTENNIYLDAYVPITNSPADDTINNLLKQFANQTVNIEADGIVHANKTITSFATGGDLTLDANYSAVNIGYNYTSKLTTLTLPVVANGQPYRGEQITKVSALVNINSTQALTIDGSDISFRFTGQSLDSAINPFSGTKKTFIGGVSTDPNIELQVSTPLQCTILGLTTEVKFGE
tara:strand:+ start:2633 stop:4651 length:2019 start_codon:yes stop_codon:yes gene_type:complete